MPRPVYFCRVADYSPASRHHVSEGDWRGMSGLLVNRENSGTFEAKVTLAVTVAASLLPIRLCAFKRSAYRTNTAVTPASP